MLEVFLKILIVDVFQTTLYYIVISFNVLLKRGLMNLKQTEHNSSTT